MDFDVAFISHFPVPCAQQRKKKVVYDKVLLKYTSIACEIELIFGDVSRKMFRKVIAPVMLLKTRERMLSL